ncbi:MAG TPA: glycerol-3-phosphate 1-O-acyltransferase PlsY, partial [candidate division Zixibacteria bacterium]|nr:glycerol-3-phosphate 1-O-acyltransferase PlsY [candidate division Zixibacteria bacterium]
MMWIGPIAVAYLLGAIPFGLLVPRLFGVADIRRHGSGNIGATNVTRVLGFRRAVWVYGLDIAKGAAAVLLGRWYAAAATIPFAGADTYVVLCGLAAVLGHLFPVYLRFRGGKGVNTALGVMLALLPVPALLAFGVFAAVFAIGRYVSLASLVAAVAFPVFILIEKYAFHRPVASVYLWVSAAVVLLIVYAHRGNIGRLRAGTEHRF